MSDRSAELASQGFTRRVTIPSALAHWIWAVDLVFEQDRRLRLVDETILRLVGAGISDPDRIAKLMGLGDSEIVPGAIANLMRRGALFHDGSIRLTDGGGAALARSSLREPRRDAAQLHLDLHRGFVEVKSGRLDLLTTTEMRGRALHQLPLPQEPTQRDLHARHILIQASLEARLGEAGGSSTVDLLRVVPSDTPQALFEEIDIEVWHRQADGAWQWRALVDGLDDDSVSRSLRALEEEHGDVIPLVPAREETVNVADTGLAEFFESASPTPEHTRFEAIEAGGDVLFFLPSFPLGFADLSILHRLGEEEGRVIRVVACVPEASEGRRNADPLQDLFANLRRRGISTRRCDLTLHYGVLFCGARAFIARYRVESIAGRSGRGFPWAEVRAVAADAVAALRDLVTRIAGEAREQQR